MICYSFRNRLFLASCQFFMPAFLSYSCVMLICVFVYNDLRFVTLSLASQEIRLSIGGRAAAEESGGFQFCL